MKKDYCTLFPESWYTRICGQWIKVDISPCCQQHDETCSMKKFFKCLERKIDVVSATLITLGGTVGCWTRHPWFTFKNYIKAKYGRKNTK